jgi:hypothetical protein
VQQGGAQGKARGLLGRGVRGKQQQQVTPPSSCGGQQEARECWTVRTNWAAADLDPGTAAAAAAAAGWSAQRGQGQPVRLQEYNSPFCQLQLGHQGDVRWGTSLLAHPYGCQKQQHGSSRMTSSIGRGTSSSRCLLCAALCACWCLKDYRPALGVSE